MVDVGEYSQHHSTDFEMPESSQSTPPAEASETPPEQIKILKFNIDGIPIGTGWAKAPNKLGQLVRTHIPIRFKNWKKVNPSYKDIVWKKMKEVFNYKDTQRKTQMKSANASWKRYKGDLREHLTDGESMGKWLEAMLISGVDPADWQVFCNNEADPKQIALRARNRKIRNESSFKSTHNTGWWGYARAEQHFKETNNGRKPLRFKLWLASRKRKKENDYVHHDAEISTKLEEHLEIMLEKNLEETLDNGPLFDQFGKDTRGRTRCIGSTISRQSLFCSSFARELLEEVDVERAEFKNEMNVLLTANNEMLLAKVSELLQGYQDCSSNQPLRSNGLSGNIYSGSTNNHPFSASVRCGFLSHTWILVAYGKKTPPGFIHVVNGHEMELGEARVLVDEVIDPSYAIWGGMQDGAKNFGRSMCRSISLLARWSTASHHRGTLMCLTSLSTCHVYFGLSMWLYVRCRVGVGNKNDIAECCFPISLLYLQHEPYERPN